VKGNLNAKQLPGTTTVETATIMQLLSSNSLCQVTSSTSNISAAASLPGVNVIKE